MNKLNPKDLTAAALAGIVTIVFYVACAVVLYELMEVTIA